MALQNAVGLDTNQMGSNLSITVNGTILQTAVANLATASARSQFGVATSSLQAPNVEFYLYSPDGVKPSLATVGGVPAAGFGFMTYLASLGTFIGADANGWLYAPDGKVYHNNAVLATWSTYTFDDVISMTIDCTNLEVTFSKNNTVQGSITISAGTYYYGASISGSLGDLGIWANAGQNPQKYPKGDGGFFHLGVGITPANLCNEPYIAAPTDIVPNQMFDGAVDRQKSPMSLVRSAASLWFMGASKPSQLSTSSQIQIQIEDPNRIYDYLLSQNVRNQVVRIRRLGSGTAVSSAEQTFTGVIDHVEQPADQEKVIYANGKLALLGAQMYRAIFPPDVDTTLAGKPLPFREGICRNFTPIASNTTNLIYPLTDAPISAFGKIRVGGVEKAYGVDCTITSDAMGLQFVTAPTDKLQVETTTFGGSFSSGATDILSGAGVFGSATANANGQPTGWTGNGGYAGLVGPTHVFQLSGTAPNKVISQAQVADAFYWLQSNSVTVAAGAMYAFEIIITQCPYYGPGVDANNNPIVIPPSGVGFCATADMNGQFYKFVQVAVTAAGTLRGFFTNTFSSAVNVCFFWQPNNMINNTGGVSSAIAISSIKLVALPAVLANITLAGPGLDYMLRRVLIDHGPLEIGDYDPTGAQAIDAATGYQYGLSISQDETPTVLSAAQQLLDSCGACFYEARDGRISVFRLTAPENATAIGSLTVSNFSGMLEPWPDNAENLSNIAQGTRNVDPASDSDFSNQTVATVPVAVRNLLKAAYQTVRASGVGLAEKYVEAVNTKPLSTCLDLAADVQTEITRVNQLYSVQRNFYVGTVFSPLGTTFDIGQVWNVTYPTGSLVNGRNLVILSVDEQPSEELSTIVFWGL